MESDSILASRRPDLFPAVQTAELVALARGLYPHTGLGAGPYNRAVSDIITQAASDPALCRVLRDGLRDLEQLASQPILEMDSNSLGSLLLAVEQTPFFAALRPRVAFHLYDDREVWEFIGYPGASFEHGGYLHRGFNDLTWLPEPRTEENTEPLTPIGPLHHSSHEPAEPMRTPG
jgi:hypothetical protein